MAFKQLKHVDKKDKYAVYGWIRNKEKILKIQNVPEMVAAICILYYRELEAFNKNLISDNLNVDDEYRIISPKIASSGGNAFGTKIAMKGARYHWKIKIEKDGSDHTPCMNIGIFQADLAKESSSHVWWGHKNGYSYYRTGTIFTQGVFGRAYGSWHGPGDIIDIWLDLKDNYCLSYGNNGENYGKAFDVDGNIKYRLALEVLMGKAIIQSFQVNY